MAFRTYGTALLFYLGLLLSAQVSALDCNFLKLVQEKFNRQSLEELEELSSKFSSKCLEQTPEFNFPEKTLRIRESQLATKAIYEILCGFFGILRSDRLRTSWEAPLRHRFLNRLFEQTERIERCLAQGKGSQGKRKDEVVNKLSLKRYFQRIRAFLEEKSSNACAYESVQLEFQMSFVYIDILMKRMDKGTR